MIPAPKKKPRCECGRAAAVRWGDDGFCGRCLLPKLAELKGRPPLPGVNGPKLRDRHCRPVNAAAAAARALPGVNGSAAPAGSPADPHLPPVKSAGARRGRNHRKIDYSDWSVCAARAKLADKRRGGADHEFIIGGFRLAGSAVVLAAIEMGPAFDVRENLTTTAPRFARWRTKQAAWQWLQLRPALARELRVIHLGRLDVLTAAPSEAPFTPGQVDPLTAGKVAGVA